MKARREHVHVYFAVEHGFLELELAERRKLNPQTGERFPERFRRFFEYLGLLRIVGIIDDAEPESRRRFCSRGSGRRRGELGRQSRSDDRE